MDRQKIAEVISGAVTAQRSAADTVATRVVMACSPAWYGRQRPDHYRSTTSEALEGLKAIGAAVTELEDLLAYYRMLWPAAHDDDPAREGYCACGRWAETCPARAACAAGELLWTGEDGTEHDVAVAAAPPEPEPEPEQPEPGWPMPESPQEPPQPTG